MTENEAELPEPWLKALLLLKVLAKAVKSCDHTVPDAAHLTTNVSNIAMFDLPTVGDGRAAARLLERLGVLLD